MEEVCSLSRAARSAAEGAEGADGASATRRPVRGDEEVVGARRTRDRSAGGASTEPQGQRPCAACESTSRRGEGAAGSDSRSSANRQPQKFRGPAHSILCSTEPICARPPVDELGRPRRGEAGASAAAALADRVDRVDGEAPLHQALDHRSARRLDRHADFALGARGERQQPVRHLRQSCTAVLELPFPEHVPGGVKHARLMFLRSPVDTRKGSRLTGVGRRPITPGMSRNSGRHHMHKRRGRPERSPSSGRQQV